MILGQSAGLAASMAIDERVAVQELDCEKLAKQLVGLGQILHHAR